MAGTQASPSSWRRRNTSATTRPAAATGPTGADQPPAIHICYTADDERVVFPTDGDLLLIATAPPVDRARSWRADHTAAYLADVRSYPPIASLLDSDGPVSEVHGVVKNRYFFRASAGPGWALIGDAGHHKDFIIGLGISDALRDARNLAAAILEGHPTSFERYWRQRDVDRMEIFHWSRDLGAPDHVNALERLVGRHTTGAPDVQPRLGAVLDGRLSPFRLVPASRAARWTLAELVRGHPRPFWEMLSAALREQRARREVSRRRRQLPPPSAVATSARHVHAWARSLARPESPSPPLARGGGLEPPTTGPEPAVLPITPPPKAERSP